MRKVKCDEGRPACNRCISTGRICDGYGIWGGGGNTYGQRKRISEAQEADYAVIPRPPVSGTNDQGYLEWFKYRTAVKLPGTFRSKFWSTLLLQASYSEPAVLHAVLALSSIHKRTTVNTDSQSPVDNDPDEQEQFALQNYVKSIKAVSRLQPRCSIRDRAPFRVALITCVVFVCMELLRGHFETAQVHLRNGITILRDMKLLSSRSDVAARLKYHRELPDDWIVEAFSRLHLQLELFQYNYDHSSLCRQGTWYEPPVDIFHALPDAWKELGRQFSGIFHLARRARQQATSGCTIDEQIELLESQQRIQTALSQWLVTWKAFKRSRGRMPEEYDTAFQVVHIHQVMATIMVDTCLEPNDETVFDSHTSRFLYLLTQLITLHDTGAPKTLPRNLLDMEHSVADQGWISSLWFVATKCRVHRIRHHAIRLLESTSHREGIWDSKTTACVAKKVAEVEERDFFDNLGTDDKFALHAIPTEQDLEVSFSPLLPGAYRLREVEVVLPGAPMDRILLFCKKRIDGIDCRVLLSEYSVHLQRWNDREDSEATISDISQAAIPED